VTLTGIDMMNFESVFGHLNLFFADRIY
jgi:hypothetical protein